MIVINIVIAFIALGVKLLNILIAMKVKIGWISRLGSNLMRLAFFNYGV